MMDKKTRASRAIKTFHNQHYKGRRSRGFPILSTVIFISKGVTINYLLLIVNCEQEVGVQKNTSKKLKQNCGQKMWWKKISAAMPNTCKNKLW